jgi:starch phosphorylase
LYDSNESTRIAQSIVLGIGGAKLLEILEMQPDIYHMNEGHALPLCFYLFAKYGNIHEVRKRVVFTTHTPEEAGNEQHDMSLLQKMSFFNGISEEEVRSILSVDGHVLNYTLSALRFAKIANGVSQMHGEVAKNMWASFGDICEITAVTNAQNKTYWKDDVMENAAANGNKGAALQRKKEMKKRLFEVVADQTGKIFDENILTIVWARRFAGYKRADLLTLNDSKFQALISNVDFPVQIIWAGKPYPEDYGAIDTFNQLFWKSLKHPNITVLSGYELHLSALLKKGSDIWLNNPRLYREASGTSGMTAAMNGSLNFSIPDGWIPEFAVHGKNAFLIEPADRNLPTHEQDTLEADRLHEVLLNEIIPMYYGQPEQWAAMMIQAMKDVSPAFESGRMAKEYYTKLFDAKVRVLQTI